MKKIGAFVVLLLLSFSFIFVIAEEEINSDEAKIEKAFTCLEERVKTCSNRDNEETALTILATPDNVFDDCVDELEGRATSKGWDGDIKDTALAILALQHAGKNTTDYEEWLLEQVRTPDDLEWYIQEDSDDKTQCYISYDSSELTLSISKDKRITVVDEIKNPCLEISNSGFWINVQEDCFGKDISIECDKKFITNLIYKNSNSNAIFVLEDTQESPADGSLDIKIESKCFGTRDCDYEDTIWAALALSRTGHNVEDFLPYIIAMSETNPDLTPDAFIYMLSGSEEYAKKLMIDQNTGKYWDSGSGSRSYDTAIVLLALKDYSSKQVDDAKKWLLRTQDSDGCWGSRSVEDTAIVLWAMTGRIGRKSSRDNKITNLPYCENAGAFCIYSDDCPDNEVMDNFYCTSINKVCCEKEHLKNCSEYGGQKCSENEFCANGNERRSLDTDVCCTGTCEDKPEKSDCEIGGYSCLSSCSEYQENAGLSCNDNKVCCKAITDDDKGSLWWVWIIILVILIAIGALAYVYRDKLKEELEKITDSFKKGPGKNGPKGPPGKPGMPPGRIPSKQMSQRTRFPQNIRQPPVAPMRKKYEEDPAMKETFRKLRDIASR